MQLAVQHEALQVQQTQLRHLCGGFDDVVPAAVGNTRNERTGPVDERRRQTRKKSRYIASLVSINQSTRLTRSFSLVQESVRSESR